MFVSRSAGCPTAHCWLLPSDCQLNAGCNACLACEMRSIRCVMFCFLVGQRTGVSAAGKPAGCGWPQAGWQCVAKIEYLIRGYVGQNDCIALTYCSAEWADFWILYCIWETSLVKSELVQFMHSQCSNNGVASSCGRDVRRCQKVLFLQSGGTTSGLEELGLNLVWAVVQASAWHSRKSLLDVGRAQSNYTDRVNIENLK